MAHKTSKTVMWRASNSCEIHESRLTSVPWSYCEGISLFWTKGSVQCSVLDREIKVKDVVLCCRLNRLTGLARTGNVKSPIHHLGHLLIFGEVLKTPHWEITFRIGLVHSALACTVLLMHTLFNQASLNASG